MQHSPADITAQVLIDAGQCTDPTDEDTWPVYVSDEPNTPDNCVTVFDTTPTDDGNSMVDGEEMGHFGLQVRVRAETHAVGWDKADELVTFLTQGVYDRNVTIDGVDYLVDCYAGANGPLALGKEAPHSKRRVFTINVTAAMVED